MHDPVRFRPGSFMPRFFLEGKSVRPEIGDGKIDADAQIAAMWHCRRLDSTEQKHGQVLPLFPLRYAA